MLVSSFHDLSLSHTFFFRPSFSTPLKQETDRDCADVLGTGGGGSPQQIFLSLREEVRKGTQIKVIDLKSLQKDDLIGWGGGMGSPEVGNERLAGEEGVCSLFSNAKRMELIKDVYLLYRYYHAVRDLVDFLKVDLKALVALVRRAFLPSSLWAGADDKTSTVTRRLEVAMASAISWSAPQTGCPSLLSMETSWAEL